MKGKYKFAVLGGDMRQYAVARELLERDVSVCVSMLCRDCSQERGIVVCDSPLDAISSADGVVLPLPVTMDGCTLNCSVYGEGKGMPLDNIIEGMDTEAVLFGGRIPLSAVTKARSRGIRVYDYFLSEELQIKNAYITAEAAVSIAMNSLDKCLRGAKVAVTGAGRISRLLSELLVKLGCSVTVCARNKDALTYFELMGCDTLRIYEGGETPWSISLAKGYDIIFNTVPSWIFGRDFLKRAERGLIMVELASSPGGIDICAARELGTNVLWASSLPGKYAPESAGRLIAACVLEEFCGEGDTR